MTKDIRTICWSDHATDNVRQKKQQKKRVPRWLILHQEWAELVDLSPKARKQIFNLTPKEAPAP